MYVTSPEATCSVQCMYMYMHIHEHILTYSQLGVGKLT